MSKKPNLSILERAEKAGVVLVIDGFSDLGSTAPPLDVPDAFGRCNVVAEARKIATKIETRRDLHSGDLVYANTDAMLEVMLKAMLAYIERHMPKGKSDAKHTPHAAADHQQDAVHGDDAPDTGAIENPTGEKHPAVGRAARDGKGKG